MLNQKYNHMICDRGNIERKGGWERSNVNRSGSTGVPSSFGNIAYSLVLLGIICNIWYWYCLCLSVWNQTVCHRRLVISDSFMVLFSMVRYGFSIVRYGLVLYGMVWYWYNGTI